MTQLSNDGTNQVRSYTEVVTSVTTPSVEITFDYTYGTDGVLVTIDGVDPTTLGITATMSNETTVAFSPPVGSGHTIKLQRVTNIDLISYAFTSGALFIASNMDSNFAQVLKSQQDVLDAFSVLTATFSDVQTTSNNAIIATNNAVNVANTSYSLLSPFIVSGALSIYTKAQVDALISTGGSSIVVPISGGGTGATTAEEARDNLGVPSISYVDIQITENTDGKMNKSANLSDVSSVSDARSNLGVYSTTEVDSKIVPATSSVAGISKLINDLTTGGTNSALSAEQGKVLANKFVYTKSDLTTSRVAGTEYTNNTGRLLIVSIEWNYSGGGTNYAEFVLDGIVVRESGKGTTVVVPPNSKYQVNLVGWVITKWYEY